MIRPIIFRPANMCLHRLLCNTVASETELCTEVGYEGWNEGPLLETNLFSAVPFYASVLAVLMRKF